MMDTQSESDLCFDDYTTSEPTSILFPEDPGTQTPKTVSNPTMKTNGGP
jgi:hypothetical protein